MIPDKALCTLKEMINDRKYTILEEKEAGICCKDRHGKHIFVCFNIHEKFNVGSFKLCIELMRDISDEKVQYKHFIIIYSNKVTPIGKKLLRNNTDIYVELFHIDRLLINITKHILVPTHILLKAEEQKSIRSKYGLKLPRLLLNDPVSRYYNYKKDDIIKIIRNRSNQVSISYRIVV